MRTEKEIYDLVLNFAFQDERIRIVTLEGSRTNVNIPKSMASHSTLHANVDTLTMQSVTGVV